LTLNFDFDSSPLFYKNKEVNAHQRPTLKSEETEVGVGDCLNNPVDGAAGIM